MISDSAIVLSSIKLLKNKKLIEGRKPNYYFSQLLAQATGQKARYSKAKAFDKQYYMDLVCKSIDEHGSLERKDIDELLWDKLPDQMNYQKKKNKVNNLISEMNRLRLIEKIGSRTQSKWVKINPALS